VSVFQQTAYDARHVSTGGEIRRTFYVQPFSAHKSLLIALRGTFVPNGSGLKRVKPHEDPLFPNYFCTEVEVTPFDREAACGIATTGFKPQDGGGSVVNDLNGLRSCLDIIPTTFDYDATLDMSVPEIQTGAPNYSGSPYQSYGTNGALVTAVYQPLLFATNLSSTQDPFDYVDPQWQPYTKSEAIGKDLVLVYQDITGTTGLGGVADSAVIAEPMVRYTVRRLMVPYLPENQICGLMNKLNTTPQTIGDKHFPVGTMRVGVPELEKKLTPDGQQYYDITLVFDVRCLYTSLNVPSTLTTANFQPGWATWNHFYAQPSTLGMTTANRVLGQKFAMYTVGWTDGYFTSAPGLTGSGYRPLYLYDTQVKYPNFQGAGGTVIANVQDLFYAGFYPQSGLNITTS
jgi:hypothetical protein